MKAREYWLPVGPDFTECKSLSLEAVRTARSWCKHLLHRDLETETAVGCFQKSLFLDKLKKRTKKFPVKPKGRSLCAKPLLQFHCF